jgi:hypothetical protein
MGRLHSICWLLRLGNDLYWNFAKGMTVAVSVDKLGKKMPRNKRWKMIDPVMAVVGRTRLGQRF